MSLISRPRPDPPFTTNGTDFDLEPFYPVPAVIARARRSSNILSVLPIPTTPIPSPLASIQPAQLEKLRTSLCGPPPPEVKKESVDEEDATTGIFASSSPGSTKKRVHFKADQHPVSRNGEEIWLTWKRAWDIWHGHYISGRVNEEWVGSQYDRIKREDEERREKEARIWARANNQLHNEARSVSETRQENVEVVDEDGEEDEDSLASPSYDAGSDIWGKEPPSVADLGGGFFPLKEFPEFEPPKGSQPSEVTGEDTGVDVEWEDPIQNSVWWPRRVGEREGSPKIEVDGNIEESLARQINGGEEDEGGFNGWVDGGVDCGRTPFPLLRSRDIYFRPGEAKPQKHTYGKYHIWDGVTGTIFNIPRQPLSSTPAPDDPQLELSQAIYGNSFREAQSENFGHANKGVFPLDIRRCYKKDVKFVNFGPSNSDKIDVKGTGKEKEDDIQEMINLDNEYTIPERREMSPSDPWWVERKQKNLRDVPSRLHPPAAAFTGEGSREEDEQDKEFFPVNLSGWKKEQDLDGNLQAQYFVTNTHGATLLINGLEIHHGEVAGPLPAFAVIECPNGQIVFWWGVGGRDYRAEKPARELDWEILRGKNEVWTNVGKMGGEVWIEKIRQRREKENTGNYYADDKKWKGYMKAFEEKIQGEKGGFSDEPPLHGIASHWDGKIGTPARAFASEEDELRYLVLKMEFEARRENHTARTVGSQFPEDDTQWPGPYENTPSPSEQAAQEAGAVWDNNKLQLITRQRLYAKQIKRETVSQEKRFKERINSMVIDARNEISKKRKSLDNLSSNSAKRPRSLSEEEVNTAKRQGVLDAAAEAYRRHRSAQIRELNVILDAKPPAGRDRAEKEFWQKVKRQERSDAETLDAINLVRKRKKLPLKLGPFGGIPIKDIEAHLETNKARFALRDAEEARRAPQSKAERDAILARAENRRAEGAATTSATQLDEEEKAEARRLELERKQAASRAKFKRKRDEDEEKEKKQTAERNARSMLEASIARTADYFSGVLAGVGVPNLQNAKGKLQTYDEQIEWAKKLSLLEAQKKQEAELKKVLSYSEQYDEDFRNHLVALDERAKTEGKTADEVAKEEGFESAGRYIHSLMGDKINNPPSSGPEKRRSERKVKVTATVLKRIDAAAKGASEKTGLEVDKNRHGNFIGVQGLLNFFPIYANAIRHGLSASAQEHGVSVDQYLQSHHHQHELPNNNTPSSQTQKQTQTQLEFILSELRKVDVGQMLIEEYGDEEQRERIKTINSAKWFRLNQMILSAEKWDVYLRNREEGRVPVAKALPLEVIGGDRIGKREKLGVGVRGGGGRVLRGLEI